MITRQQLARYALWLGVVITARADRKETGLATAWVFHLVGNSLSLLLPEIYRAARAGRGLDRAAAGSSSTDGALRELVLENPRYLEYVTPPALAFILTYPGINIYKSEWANRQLFGMGLDSIPHFTTAFATARLIFDIVAALRRHAPASSPYAARIEWADRHPAWTSGAIVAAATAFYESGEYVIHRAELRAVHNDPRKIAMEWSVADTLQDIFSNLLGWLFAVWLQYKKRP